jgi:branched-chain amino acid transport system permease protein
VDFFDGLFTDPAGWYGSHQLLVGQMGVNALLAISIWVTLYAGQLTMANIGFMAIGGYTTVILAFHFGTPLLLGALAGAALAVVVALIIGLPVLRLKGLFVAIATIGFGEAIRFGVILNLGITGRGQGLNNPSADPGAIWPIWLSVAVATWVGWRITRSRLGSAWAAIREDELAARSHGVDATRYKLVAFLAGAALAAWAGALEANLNFFIDPTEYAVNRAIFVLVLAVVGGVATVFGPVVGAVLLTALPEIVRDFATYREVVYGALLIVITIFRPQGLVGRPQLRFRRRHQRRPAAPNDV